MSDGCKIDENITEQSLAENGDKEDEALNNSVSDGEIVDDDEPEEAKTPIINFSCHKTQKNIRARHEKSDSDDEGDGKSGKKEGITDGELKKLKAHIDNGDQMLDKNALEDFRKKIIDELGRKDSAKSDKKQSSDSRKNSDSHRNNQISRFSAAHRQERDGFRRNNIQPIRRNGVRGVGNHFSFKERNRSNLGSNNNLNRSMFRVNGVERALFFPKNIIKHTKTSPSISYSESPNVHRRFKRNAEEREVKSGEKNKKSTKNSKEKSKGFDKKTDNKTPSKESPDLNNKKPEQKDNQEPEVKQHDEEKIQEIARPDGKIEDRDGTKQKSPTKSPPKSNKSPEKLIVASAPEKLGEKSKKLSKSSEKLKVELKFERKKSPKRIEKPKVNIFLEDSDEVDEFEKIPTEVKSRWSSPELFKPVAEVPKIVPAPIVEYKMIDPEIPVVIESPESSPVISHLLSNNLFKPSSVSMEKSPTPSPPPRPTKVRNVCSFLSDIASGNIFSGLGLGSGLYDNDSISVGLNLNEHKVEIKDLLPETKKLERKIILETEKIMEPDTTADKLVDKTPEKVSSDDSDSDDSDSDTSSSSDSDSDDTTSESEESSEESSDDDVPSFTRGFGRFDASSMPMVMQIKPTTSSLTPTTQTSRFQQQQSIIKTPGLVTSAAKSTLYTPTAVQAMPTVTTPFSVGVGAFPFPIPFKIYSLRDTNNSEIIFSSSVPPIAAVTMPSSIPSDKTEKDKKTADKLADKDRRDRKRSRSHSRERDKKRFKDDRRKTPPRRRSSSPSSKKRHADDRSRQTEDRKDSRRRDSSPRHSSHHSRSSHTSRHSPVRRQRKSRSRTPQRVRSPIARPRSPPRPRTPPAKPRRSPPTRRSVSRSPPNKYRRSSSPSSRKIRSPSPGYRRSPRRRYSPSPIGSNRNRRTPSPDYRYDRRSFSPTFRNKLDSPLGYKPDSTISDTELERQQQYMQEEFYLSKWNNSSSPKRPNLDDRIHRMLSDSPTHVVNSNAPHNYHPESYPYPMQHENHSGMFYPDLYQANHQMPAHVHLQSQTFLSQSLNHHGPYDEFNNFPSPRNFVNNSNLVEITQQKRDRQRAGSSQAVQVGNVLEIVPNNKIATSPETPNSKEQFDKTKPLSPEQMRQQAEKRVQAKLKRKIDRERKRSAKHTRKEKLRHEIRRYLEAGVTAENSDDENLIPLRTVNIAAAADRSILKKTKNDVKSGKKVLFSDGILPGETTSEDDDGENEDSAIAKLRRKKLRKKRLMQLIRSQTLNGLKDFSDVANDPELEKAPPPPAPLDAPPAHLKQPRLKKITMEMFAAFPVNVEPIYYYIQKMQQASNGYHQVVPPPRMNDRFHYYKKQPPPNVGQSPSYLQQQRSAISKQPSSVSSLDPRINQQRTVEKTFA